MFNTQTYHEARRASEEHLKQLKNENHRPRNKFVPNVVAANNEPVQQLRKSRIPRPNRRAVPSGMGPS